MSSTELMHEYELVYIAQPELEEEGVTNLNDRFTQTVANFGGEMLGIEPWGRRTLAYPIKNFFQGQYILLRFHMQPAGAEEVDRFLRLNEDVLRYLLIRTDE